MRLLATRIRRFSGSKRVIKTMLSTCVSLRLIHKWKPCAPTRASRTSCVGLDFEFESAELPDANSRDVGRGGRQTNRSHRWQSITANAHTHMVTEFVV